MPRVSTHFGLQDPRFQSLVFPLIVPTTLAADSNQTLTTDQVLGGLIIRSFLAARSDTLPTAAALVEAIQGCMVGTSFRFLVRNAAAGAFAQTLVAGTGGTVSGTATVAQNNAKEYLVVFTNVTAGSEAYTVYSISTGVF